MSLFSSMSYTLRLGSLLLGLSAPWVMADEAALYGPAAPHGSAFVRGFNAANSSFDANLGPVRINDLGAKSSSDFAFLPAGKYTVSADSKSLAVKLDAERYYTLVQMPDGALELVEEPPFKNRQKSLLRLQNLSDTALSIKTADGRTEVIHPVSANARGEREINPVKVRLTLFAGDRKIRDLDPLVLERGEVVSLFVTGSADKLSPAWVKRPVATN